MGIRGLCQKRYEECGYPPPTPPFADEGRGVAWRLGGFYESGWVDPRAGNRFNIPSPVMLSLSQHPLFK